MTLCRIIRMFLSMCCPIASPICGIDASLFCDQTHEMVIVSGRKNSNGFCPQVFVAWLQ